MKFFCLIIYLLLKSDKANYKIFIFYQFLRTKNYILPTRIKRIFLPTLSILYYFPPHFVKFCYLPQQSKLEQHYLFLYFTNQFDIVYFIFISMLLCKNFFPCIMKKVQYYGTFFLPIHYRTSCQPLTGFELTLL